MIAFQTIDPKKPIENGIHFLPCTIEKDGEANVDVYFDPLIETEKSDWMEIKSQCSNYNLNLSINGENLSKK